MMSSLGMPEGEAERTLKAADTAGDGTIGFEEVCATCARAHVCMRECECMCMCMARAHV